MLEKLTNHVSWQTQVRTIVLLIIYLNPLSLVFAWHTLSPGIDYLKLETHRLFPWSCIHAFKINLKKNKLSSMIAQELAVNSASIDKYRQHGQALIAINGGFFDENFKPIGLRINNHQQKSSLKKISWWDVFYIKKNKAYLATAEQFRDNNQTIGGVDFAVQSGPRLLINGHVPTLKPGRSMRSALGITNDNEVIILLTDHEPLSTTELANLMKKPPFECENALNLDGGSSSQLQAYIDLFKLDVHGFSNIADAIVVNAN
jgi:uncharacterized protein YigE (DUF2233 family)